MRCFRVLHFGLFLLCFVSGLDAATWSGLETLGTSSNFPDPHVAVDPQGNAVAVFASNDETQMWIMGTRMLVGGDWSTPVPIVPAISYDEDTYFKPVVVMDNQGNAIAVWTVNSDGSGTNSTQGATLSINSDTWIPSQILSQLIRVMWEPHLTCDAQGNAIAAWEEWDENQILQISSARYNASSQSWSLLQPLQVSSDDLYDINVDVDGTGRAIMVWTEQIDSAVNNILRASTLAVNGTQWGPAETLFDGRVTDNVVVRAQLAVDAKGNAVIVWVTMSQDESHYTLNAFKRAFNSVTWKPVQCPDVAVDWFVLTLAMDPSGNAQLLYKRDDNPYTLMNAQLASSSYSWTTPIPVTPVGDKVFYTAFGVDQAGNAIAIWSNELTGRLYASTLPNGSKVWASPTSLTTSDASYATLDLALDSKGTSVAVCTDITNYSEKIVESITGQNLFPTAKKKQRGV